MPPGSEAGRSPRSAALKNCDGRRSAYGRRVGRCRVAVDLVGLEQVDPAVDQERDALLEDRRRGAVTVAELASVITLSTMMLVPPDDRGPEVDHELVVLIGLFKRRAPGGV